MYSEERIITRFQKLVGRNPVKEEITFLKNSKELLSNAIAKLTNITVPQPLIAAGAHCKTCGPDID